LVLIEWSLGIPRPAFDGSNCASGIDQVVEFLREGRGVGNIEELGARWLRHARDAIPIVGSRQAGYQSQSKARVHGGPGDELNWKRYTPAAAEKAKHNRVRCMRSETKGKKEVVFAV
jgi:hypothetical protein